jgi:hypothetical protein
MTDDGDEDEDGGAPFFLTPWVWVFVSGTNRQPTHCQHCQQHQTAMLFLAANLIHLAVNKCYMQHVTPVVNV